MSAAKQQGCALRLDLANELVWRENEHLRLTPKAFAVLRYLLERPSQLVTKETLLQTVWPDTEVSEWALTTCMREIRKALRKQTRAPRYIETVYRRGYRFIGQLSSQQLVVSTQHNEVGERSLSPSPSTPSTVACRSRGGVRPTGPMA